MLGSGTGHEWVFSLRKKGRLETQPELWEDPHPRICSLLHPKDENTAVSPPRVDVQAGTGCFGPQVDRGTLSGTWPAEAAGKIRSGQPASSIFQLEDPRPGSLLAPWPAPKPQPSSQTQRSRDGAGSRAPVMLLILVRGGSLSMCTPSCPWPNKGGFTIFRLGCGLRTPEPQRWAQSLRAEAGLLGATGSLVSIQDAHHETRPLIPTPVHEAQLPDLAIPVPQPAGLLHVAQPGACQLPALSPDPCSCSPCR